MNSIAVVTDSKVRNNRISKVAAIIKDNLQEVLSDRAVINTYYIDELKENDKIAEDIVIIMAGSRALKVKKHVENHDRIIIARRAFLKAGIDELYNIPEGSNVLVVNDNLETVLECVSSLYNIGIKHVNLIPYELGKDYRDIKYAVSPSENDFVPDYIEHIYDMKNRVVDIPTMLMIMGKLGIEDKETQQRLYNYYQKIFSVNETIKENYNSLLTKTEELDYMLDLSHDGIILTDPSGRILIHNKKFAEIFEINGDVLGKQVQELLKDVEGIDFLKNQDINEIIEYRKKVLNLEKKNITHFNKEKRIYFSFQEVTYIKKLEQNLSQKLRQKGHIAKYRFEDIVTGSNPMLEVIENGLKIAKSDLTVLITGESGTGKEVLAQAIHNASDRKNQPFIAINTSAIPEHLMESELFGYVSGSFTGALKQGKQGLFELANNGTIFLDEIGDMPIYLQSKLLRVLQESQIAPVGSDQIIDIDVRIIAATHKNPSKLIEEGKFRLDLFYRLNVFPIELPPLRDRKEDILPLLNLFTDYKFKFDDTCIEALSKYVWPGNIRELNNVSKYINTVEKSIDVTCSSLPKYLLDQISKIPDTPIEKDYISDEDVLALSTGLSSSVSVLKAIKVLNDIGKTAGRKHICEVLARFDTSIKEAELRKILTILSNQGYINIKKGRSGCYITTKGTDLLKGSSN